MLYSLCCALEGDGSSPILSKIEAYAIRSVPLCSSQKIGQDHFTEEVKSSEQGYEDVLVIESVLFCLFHKSVELRLTRGIRISDS